MKNYPPDSVSEAALVTGLKAKDRWAFEYLYAHYKGTLFYHISQFVSDPEQGADLLQEAFMGIYNYIDKYDESKARLFTWMLTLTRNKCINFLRSKSHKNQLQNENPENLVYGAKEQGSTLSIDQMGLRNFVHQLKPEHKAVVELTYFLGHTREEAAQILNIPEGTVKTRLRAALVELRKIYLP